MLKFQYKIFKIPLSLAIIFTVLIFACALNYLILSLNSFYTYQRIANPGLQLTFERLHHIYRNHLRMDFYSFFQPPPPADTKLDKLYITIDRKDIDSLNSDLPESGKSTFYPAYLRVNDEKKIRKIDLRYRGDSFFHWLYPKKSLRIKTAIDDLVNSHRTFNLITLPHNFMINEVINYQISRELGLLAPDFFPVTVYINDEYYGVYFFLSQIDESLLRRHKRMPGSMYSGDSMVMEESGEIPRWFRQQYEEGTSILLYKDWWEKIASRSREQVDYTEDLSILIELLNEQDKAKFFERAQHFFDLEKIYTFLAYDSFTGSHHHDLVHNHKVYFDPYKGKFEWIQWDLRYWNPFLNSKDLTLHPLLRQFILNPVLESFRDKKLFEIINKYPFPTIRDSLYAVYNNVVDETMADKYRLSLLYDIPFDPKGYSSIFSLEEFKVEIDFISLKLKERINKLSSILENTNVKYHTQRIADNIFYLTFGVSGNSGVAIRLNEIFKEAGTEYKGLSIYRDVDKNRKISAADTHVNLNDEEILLPGRKLVEGNALGHKNVILFGDKQPVPHPLYYSYLIKNTTKLDIDHIRARNTVTGSTVLIMESVKKDKDVDEFTISAPSDSIHPWNLNIPKEKTIHIKGEITLTETRIFNKAETVIIHPGTTIRLASGVSIVFFGKVSAQGSEEQPIVITRMNKDVAWGSVIIQGKDTSGSILSHVQVDGGSTATVNLIQYPGQFNVHDTSNITISNCLFKNNTTGDDNVHLAYLDGLVESTIFYNSNMDGLDVDISRVEINNSVFINSGNDGLDLMTSEVRLAGNYFYKTGDKCISVGENSTLDVSKSYLQLCNIGIETKDLSHVNLSKVLIRDSQSVSLNSYNKNKQYDGGGHISGDDVYLVGNSRTKQDESSSLTIGDIYSAMPEPEFFNDFSGSRLLTLKPDYNYDPVLP